MNEKELRESAIESIRSKVCGERLKEYGSVESNFGRIAALWNVWLKKKNVELGPEDVAAMMILMKVARLIENPFHLDSAIDAGGYAVCLSVLAMRAEETVKQAESLASELNGIASAEATDRKDWNPTDYKGTFAWKDLAKAQQDAVDHGEEELKRTGKVLRCGAVDSLRNQCVLNKGHNTDHSFEAYYQPIQ